MRYEFVIIGAGIAGSAISYFLQNRKVLVVDKEGICQKASNAAGAFLFPKVGFNTKYTKFVNEALLYSFKIYESIGIDTNKTGVLILPRDEKDIQKFKEYKKGFTLKYFEKENGFFFLDGGIVNSEKVCEKLLENCEFKKEEILNIEEKGGYYLLNNKIETENIILATGWEEILKIPYIKIRPVWGQRIEIETDISLQNHTHKNCSISKNENGIVKIGATHERIWEDKAPNQVSAQILIDKANEITKLTNYKIYSMKSGMRAGSVDYFPIIGEVIDTEKTLQLYPEVKKGRIPKEVIYKKGIFVINGGGGRGFSNYVYSAKILSEAILNNKIIPEYLDSKRLFIKWARKL